MDGFDDLGERELWELAIKDPEAFGEVLRRHARAVHRYCYWKTGDAALAEDLTSVIFLEAWRRRQTASITGTSLRPWLLGVAHNCARNAARSLRRHASAMQRVGGGDHMDSGEDHAIERLDAELSMIVARIALASLSDAEREIVLLVFWSGLTYEETAAALKIPLGTVRSRVSRTRRKLQESIPLSPASKGTKTTEFNAPTAPSLQDAWIERHRDELVAELSFHAPRRSRRAVVSVAVAGAAGAIALSVGLRGFGATPAFAGWTDQPTSPTPGQLPTAESACSMQFTNLSAVSQPNPANPPSALPPIALTDTRGPYSLIVYGTAASPMVCASSTSYTELVGDGFGSASGLAPASAGQSTQSVSVTHTSTSTVGSPGFTSALPPAWGVANIDFAITATADGQPFTVVEGSTGPGVSDVTLQLSDQTNVVASMSNGVFAAWWPGEATVTTLQVTSASGAG